MADTATVASAPQTMADVLGKTIPALSATSDMPVVDTPSESASNDQKPEPAVEAATEVEAIESPEGDKLEVEAKPDNTPPEIKREITKARNKQREAEARAVAAEKTASEEAARLKDALESLKALTTKPAETEPDEPRPTRDKYDDPDKYDADLTEWARKQGVKAATAEAEKAKIEADRKAGEDARNDQFAKTVESFKSRREVALAEIPDYVEVAEAEGVQISLPMRDAILTADNGPQIAYHLGKNPTEAERISKLSPGEQFFELGRISAKLSAPKEARVTQVPEPIKPLGTRASASVKDPGEMSMDEYAAYRKAQRNGAGTHPH